MAVQAKKYEKGNHDKREKIHLLSGILKCPVCGAGMYGNKSIKKRKQAINYCSKIKKSARVKKSTYSAKWS